MAPKALEALEALETLTALKGAILKWEQIVAGIRDDRCSSDCPLCKYFPYCNNCPVALHTKRDHCRGTPYDDWRRNTYTCHDGYVFYRLPHAGRKAEAQTAAQAMLDFLRSLLPTEEPHP